MNVYKAKAMAEQSVLFDKKEEFIVRHSLSGG